MPDPLGPTDRTRVRRKAQRGAYDAATVHAILDEALVCHVAFVLPAPPPAADAAVAVADDNAAVALADARAATGSPVVIPTTHVRLDDRLYMHDAAANHMLSTLSTSIEVCVAVTLLDGLVFARTAFHHSVNYRSVVLFGRAATVTDDGEKRRALDALVDKLAPNRSAACRPPSDKELAATQVIALPIVEASAKIRRGPPLADDGADAALPYWAGVVPLRTERGSPETAPDCAIEPPFRSSP